MNAKNYNFNYSSVLCINDKLSDNINKRLDFKKGYYYPFLCMSYDLTQAIDPSRAVQLITESGYKITLKDKELLHYFDIEKILFNRYKSNEG